MSNEPWRSRRGSGWSSSPAAMTWRRSGRTTTVSSCSPGGPAPPPESGIVALMSSPVSQIRLLLVEDVPQVAQYVRGLLDAQQSIKLVDVVADGGRAAAQVQQLRPHVVIVDWLLQGRTKARRVVELIREVGPGIPLVVL